MCPELQSAFCEFMQRYVHWPLCGVRPVAAAEIWRQAQTTPEAVHAQSTADFTGRILLRAMCNHADSAFQCCSCCSVVRAPRLPHEGQKTKEGLAC